MPSIDDILPHQLQTVEYGIKNPYFIMGLFPGAGKTLSVIYLVQMLKKKFEREVNTLYICPASYKISTKHEILKWFPDAEISCFLDRKKLYTPWASDIAIINFEMVKYAEDLFSWADIVVIDEAHYIKEMKAQRTELIHRYIFEREVKRVVMMTGTPISNQVVDFYSLIALCMYNPRIKEPEFLKRFPTSIDFAEHFSYRKEVHSTFGTKVTYEGIRNIPELKKYLRDIFISFDPDKILKIPGGITKDVQAEELDCPELMEDFEAFQDSSQGESVKSKAKAMAALAMAPFTIEYAKNLLAQGVDKIVIFSDHVESIKKIAEAFEVEPLTSAMDPSERAKKVEGFQTFPTIQVICGTTGTLGCSFTLTASCNLIVNDLPWRPGDLRQLMDRIRRICQKRTPIYHFMHGTYQSKYILRKLEAKMETIKKVLG